MEKLLAFLARHDFPTDHPLDGRIHRFDREGELSGWFIGTEITTASGKRLVNAKMGDWKSGAYHEFDDDVPDLTEAEAADILLAKKEAERKLKEETARVQEEVSALCEKLWAAGHGPNGHVSPYLQRKKIDQLYGVRTITTEELEQFLRTVEGRDVRIPPGHVNLLVPARDVDGKLWGIQTIRPDGGKNFKPGQKVQGVFHTLGAWPADNGLLYLAEGFATAASIHLATNSPVVSCFHAGNIPAVAKAIRKKYPQMKLVICADDDRFTVLKNGKPYNAGLSKAHDAASDVGARVVAPRFASDDGKPTDFNDLHVREGIAVVTEQLREDSNSSHLMALPGKMSPAKHQQAAQALLHFYGDKMRKQGRDLFGYTGTHWKWLDTPDLDRLKMQLQPLMGGQATSPQLSSAFNLFCMGVQPVPENVDLFTPPQWCANFLNGTLHVEKRPGERTYALRFAPHRMTDWAVNVLPYDYREGDTERNPEFEAMLERVFEGDPDRPEKIRALAQMYGSALIPAFPHLFMLYGAPGTGKSTAIILAARLVHKDNACSVDPTEFSDFNMESMAGRLVNYDTDIEMHKPISEKQVKKIIDRLPFRIRRKGLKDIYAPIPAVHIFGGNDIPKTLDGASRAHDRRWTFIEFRRIVAVGNYDIDYASYCFQQSPQGVLNFALRGLQDLCDQGGHFSEPESGRVRKEEWQLDTDPVGQFIEDAKRGAALLDGNAQVLVGENRRIPKADLWRAFVGWHSEVHQCSTRLSKIVFNRVMKSKGFREVASKGVDFWAGIGMDVVATSRC